MKNIILASSSTSRQRLLDQMGLEYTVVPSSVDESGVSAESTSLLVQKLAKLKATDVAQEYPDSIVIGGDTLVEYQGEQIGKPEDAEAAFQTLKKLQGKSHTIYSGVCVVNNGQEIVQVGQAQLWIVPMSDDEIREYVSSGEPLDKAGAYAIAGLASRYVEKIEGDYSSIIGLPVAKLYQIISNIKDLRIDNVQA